MKTGGDDFYFFLFVLSISLAHEICWPGLSVTGFGHSKADFGLQVSDFGHLHASLALSEADLASCEFGDENGERGEEFLFQKLKQNYWWKRERR